MKFEDFKKFLKKSYEDFHKNYTYCEGCKKWVKQNAKYVEQIDIGWLYKCNECNTVWNFNSTYKPIEEEFSY